MLACLSLKESTSAKCCPTVFCTCADFVNSTSLAALGASKDIAIVFVCQEKNPQKEKPENMAPVGFSPPPPLCSGLSYSILRKQCWKDSPSTFMPCCQS